MGGAGNRTMGGAGNRTMGGAGNRTMAKPETAQWAEPEAAQWAPPEAEADVTESSASFVLPDAGELDDPEADLDLLAEELQADGVEPGVPDLEGGAPTRRSDRCEAAWRARLAKLAPEIREALAPTGPLTILRALDSVQQAIDLGARDVNILTDFAYFAVYAHRRGYCPIRREDKEEVGEWLYLHKEVSQKLAAPAKAVEQHGPVPCVGPRENRLAAPAPDNAPDGLTGRYEYTLVGHTEPDGALALNQAGRHVEVSLAPFAEPGSRGRSVVFYAGDLDARARFLLVNKENLRDRRILVPRGSELDIVRVDGSAVGVARRWDSRASLFPVTVRSISRSLDGRKRSGLAGSVGEVVDVAKSFLSTIYVGPFLYRQEHLPLARSQVAFLGQRFTSAEFTGLVRRAAALKGHRSADKSAREELHGQIERYVDQTVNDRGRGVHQVDYPLARAVVRRLLSQRGFSDGKRRQSHLDWIQLVAEVTDRPVAADSVLGVRPSEGKVVGEYEYDVRLEVVEGAFFIGGGVGGMTVQQTKPTRWDKPFRLKVWFGAVGGSVKVGTDSIDGTAVSFLPWTPADFVGRVEWIEGGASVSAPGAEAALTAGFLHIYGSEVLPPLTVLSSGPELNTAIDAEKDGRWKLKVGASIGATGRMGRASATGPTRVVDVTRIDPEPVYAARGGGRQDVHFCFDSALLTPAARQNIRIVAALWRPFLVSSPSALSIVGYADKAGSEEYNRELSHRRAKNTLTAFRDVLGGAFAVSKVNTTGMGEAGARGGGPRAGAADRRVEVRLDGMTILVLAGE